MTFNPNLYVRRREGTCGPTVVPTSSPPITRSNQTPCFVDPLLHSSPTQSRVQSPAVVPTPSPPITRSIQAGLALDTETSSYVGPLLQSSPIQVHVQTPTFAENLFQSSLSQAHVQILASPGGDEEN